MKKIFFIFGTVILATLTFNADKTYATSGACSSHWGVNCSAEQDWDGSVICNDGWRESSVQYFDMVMCNEISPYYKQMEFVISAQNLFTKWISQYNQGLLDSGIITNMKSVRSSLAIPGDKDWITSYFSNTYHQSTTSYAELLLIYNLTQSTISNLDYIINRLQNNLSVSIGMVGDPNYMLYQVEYIPITQYIPNDKTNTYSILDYNEVKNDQINSQYVITSNNINTCEAGYHWNKSANNCILDNLENIVCNNNENAHLEGDNCVCDSGYGWSAKQSKCVLGSTVCSEQFGDNTEYIQSTGKCICVDDYYNSGGKCIKSSYTPPPTPECEDGYVYAPASYICVKIKENQIFNDITESSNAYTAIKYLKINSVIDGYPDGTFKPENTVNRAELIKILIGERYSTSGYGNCFEDVKNEWFAPYVCYAKEQEWISGYADGTFKPAQTVNRAEAIKMAIEVFGIELPQTVNSSPYSDVNKDTWFASYVQIAKESGLFDDSMTSYGASNGMKRGDISDIIYRLLAIKKLGVNEYTKSLDTEMNSN